MFRLLEQFSPLAPCGRGVGERGQVAWTPVCVADSTVPLSPTLPHGGGGGGTTAALGAFVLGLSVCVHAAPSNLGRPATLAEIKAWDIDVRPDFKGLPAGSGSVSKGQDVWEAKCESCHGAFGESNEYFTPIVGHTTQADTQSGNVAVLRGNSVPQRTSLMKLSQLSTLWDYISRAMPWNAPKSLTTDEVYAVTAYILSLGNIVPADFVLSDKNIAETQKKLPNRNGLTLTRTMWNAKDKPDVQGANCATNCKKEVTITSQLPDYARNAHGNLADQNRIIGAIRGVDTRGCSPEAPKPCGSGVPATSIATGNRGDTARTVPTAPTTPDPSKLAQQHACTACHGVNNKILGPSFVDVQKKYGVNAAATLAAKIKAGGSGVWGSVPMPPQAHVPDADIRAIAEWLANGKLQ